MIESHGKAEAQNLGKNWGLIQSGSVLTGILYALVFLLMIPTFINLGYTFDDMLINTGLIIASILIVHFLINGFYYLLVAVPLVLAVIFAILGWFIWLNTPLLFTFVDALLGFFNISTTNLCEYLTRIGQSLMIFGGGLWWLVKKAKDINYAAIYIYIIILGLLGIFSGLIYPSISILFLIFWATLSYKIHENPNINTNNQLKLLFKVVASLSILLATYRNINFANNTWYRETSYGLIIYSIIVFLLVSFGIWKPKTILKVIPAEAQNIGKRVFELTKKFVYIKK